MQNSSIINIVKHIKQRIIAHYNFVLTIKKTDSII